MATRSQPHGQDGGDGSSIHSPPSRLTLDISPSPLFDRHQGGLTRNGGDERAGRGDSGSHGDGAVAEKPSARRSLFPPLLSFFSSTNPFLPSLSFFLSFLQMLLLAEMGKVAAVCVLRLEGQQLLLLSVSEGNRVG